MYERYQDRGFAVLGFPSNDFANQDPGTDKQIGAFCRANYGVQFPMFSKVHVKGVEAHPVYTYLTTLPQPMGGPVEWNFQKYLIDRNGSVVARYAPSVDPADPTLVSDLERVLQQNRPGVPQVKLLQW